MRSKTIPNGTKLYNGTRALAVSLGDGLPYPEDAQRPLTRGDCEGMPRPCPYVSCSMHLYLDVDPDTGALKLNFPGLEVDELRETCALDVAAAGGVTLDAVGDALSITRERVRQIETQALVKIKDHTGVPYGR